MKIISICGIDTGVGKSVVTGLLGRFLLDQGASVLTQKLVQTGCAGRSEDIVVHRRLMAMPWQDADEEGLTCPYCFPFPASPHLAAELEGEEIDPVRLTGTSRELAGRVDWLLVEGVGGLLVPLNRDLLLLDYLARQQYPLILVSTPRLGSINHTLLSLEAIRQRSARLLGLVYNLHGDFPPEIVRDSMGIFRAALRNYGFSAKLLVLPDSRESMATNWQQLLEAV